MKHYALFELEVTDPAWVRDYIANVTRLVEERGGRYLARTQDIKLIEGEPHPNFVVLLEWPSKEDADAFYDSEAYRPYRAARQAGARNRAYTFTGRDDSGAAR